MNNLEKFNEAMVYASNLHKDQKRKGTDIPYITHLMAVASLAGEAGGTTDEMIAALLHDAVEDQGGAETLAEIKKRFGDTVAGIVEACSDTDVVPKPPWKERKLAYLKHLNEINDRSILMVSCADKLHNANAIAADLRDMGEAVWNRFNASKEDTIWYYRQLLECYKKKSVLPGRLVNEFERVVGNLK